MLAVFRLGANREDAIHDARTLEAVCLEQARMIECSEREDCPFKLGSPGDIEDLRVATCYFLRDGKSYLGKYEERVKGEDRDAFAWTVGSFLHERVGDKGDEPLTKQQKQQWAATYRDIAAKCHEAAEGL